MMKTIKKLWMKINQAQILMIGLSLCMFVTPLLFAAQQSSQANNISVSVFDDQAPDQDHSFRDPWSNSFYQDFSSVHGHVNQMMRQMNRLFYDEDLSYSPQFDVKQTKESLIVSCDLPGMEKDQINVSVENGHLIISGQRKVQEEQKSDEDGRYLYRSVKNYGQFSRSFALPEGVNPEKLNAKYDKGVLKVTIPYEKSDDAFKIDVQ